MSDASSTFASVYEYNGLRLPQLSVKEYGEVERAARERARQNLLALLEDLKADLPNKIALMEKHDRQLPRLSQTAAHCETADGAIQAVKLSLVLGGMTATEAMAAIVGVPGTKPGISIMDLTELALKVTTLDKLFPPPERPTAGKLIENTDGAEKKSE